MFASSSGWRLPGGFLHHDPDAHGHQDAAPQQGPAFRRKKPEGLLARHHGQIGAEPGEEGYVNIGDQGQPYPAGAVRNAHPDVVEVAGQGDEKGRNARAENHAEFKLPDEK